MPDLSKVQIGGQSYNLKDAQARANIATLLGSHALEALGDAAWKAVVAEIGQGSANLPTAAAVKDYVDAQIETIPTFDVVVVQELPTPSAETFHKIYLLDATSPAAPNLYMEYITIRSGSEGSYTYTWEKIGDTEMDLSGYVKKTQTIASIALDHNITAAEIIAALELKALAFKDSASGEVAGQTISGLKAEGNIDLELEGDLGYTSTAATLTRAAYTPAGEVSVALSGNNVLASVASAGTLPTYAEGAFSAGTLPAFTEGAFDAGSLPSLGAATTAAFASEGLVAEVGTGEDAETLIFTAAGTANAVTAQGTFNAGSLPTKAADTFSAGTLPSKAADTFTAGAMPTFTEGTVGVQSASFTGTEVANFQVTGVNYDKANAGTLDVKAADISLDVDDVVVSAKNVTVE